MENSKIVLYKEREFGDIFNVTFAFIKQEFKPLGMAIIVFILPFILIQGVLGAMFQTTFFSLFKNANILANGFGNFFSTFMSNYLLILIASIVEQTMIYVTIGSYLKLYSKSENEITISEIANEIKNCFLPVLGGVILFYLVFLVGLVLCVLPGIYLAISLSVFLLALVIEQKGIGDAFSRSFQLVHLRWWWTFLLLFVSGILLWILAVILQIPTMVMTFTSAFHSVQAHTNPMEAFGSFYVIYNSIVSAIVQLIYIFPVILLAFQYFNLVEIREKSSLNQKINEIGKTE